MTKYVLTAVGPTAGNTDGSFQPALLVTPFITMFFTAEM
jgi:hypothetical protein